MTHIATHALHVVVNTDDTPQVVGFWNGTTMSEQEAHARAFRLNEYNRVRDLPDTYYPATVIYSTEED